MPIPEKKNVCRNEHKLIQKLLNRGNEKRKENARSKYFYKVTKNHNYSKAFNSR